MMSEKADVLVIGAGIAGVSAAYHLAVTHGVDRVVVCDPRAPLTLTSDKSTECYRNWWPGPGDAMVRLMNRSIDLFERWADESSNTFNLTRRGYLYLTSDPSRFEAMRAQAEAISALGAGELRIHRGRSEDPAYGLHAFDGADLLGPEAVLARFPYVSGDVVGGIHVRRAGWLSAQQLGAWLLDRSLEAGVVYRPDSVVECDVSGGRVRGAVLSSGLRIETARIVNAAGPHLGEVAAMLGSSLPLLHEVHRKMSFRDQACAIPRDAPMLIWNDPQRLGWETDEREALMQDPDLAPLAGMLPPGAHCRPDGGTGSPIVLGLWEYRSDVRAPTFPIPEDPLYPEMVMRGLSTMIPALGGYLDRLPQPYVDGGYYTKTVENRPLIGPAGPEGVYVVGALSGYGIMAAPAAGELVASHIVGGPWHAPADAFLPSRYDDPAYLAAFENADHGQL